MGVEIMHNKISKFKSRDGTTKYFFNITTGINPKTGKKSSTTRRGFLSEKEAKAAYVELWNEIHKDKYVAQTTIAV